MKLRSLAVLALAAGAVLASDAAAHTLITPAQMKIPDRAPSPPPALQLRAAGAQGPHDVPDFLQLDGSL
jgi:hypothetical protein